MLAKKKTVCPNQLKQYNTFKTSKNLIFLLIRSKSLLCLQLLQWEFLLAIYFPNIWESFGSKNWQACLIKIRNNLSVWVIVLETGAMPMKRVPCHNSMRASFNLHSIITIVEVPNIIIWKWNCPKYHKFIELALIVDWPIWHQLESWSNDWEKKLPQRVSSHCPVGGANSASVNLKIFPLMSNSISVRGRQVPIVPAQVVTI